MLVLTRKAQEKIRIGDDIVVTVLRTKGNAVRIGIEAPGDVRVLRGEIAFEGDEPNDENPTEERAFHARMPRADVARVLPQLATEGGPLAGFINSGSAASF